MTAFKFLSSGDLCVQIFALRSTQDQVSAGAHAIPEVVQVLASLNLNIFHASELRQVVREIQVDHLNFIDVLEAHQFAWKYRPDIMDLICRNYESLSSCYPTVSQITLLSCIAWLYEYKFTKDDEFLLTLIETLLHISRPINFPIFPHIQQLSVSALFHVFNAVLVNSQRNHLTPLFKHLRSFYMLNVQMPPIGYELLSKFVALVAPLHDLGSEEVKREVYDYVGSVCDELDSFTSDVAESIVSSLMKPILELDPKALFLFSHLTPKLSNETALKTISLFTNSMGNWLRQGKPHFVLQPLTCELPRELPALGATEVTLRFWDQQVFVNGINLKPNIVFPDRIDYETFIPESVRELLVAAVEATRGNQSLVDYLMDSLMLLRVRAGIDDQAFVPDICLVFLFMCFNLRDHIERKEVMEVLFDPPFFDPRVTVFDQNDDYEKIDAMRSAVIDIVLTNCERSLELLFTKWVQYPYLFAEIAHRFIRNYGIVKQLDAYKANIYSKALMTTSMYYQSLHYILEEKSSIEVARTSILLLISRVLGVKEAMPLFFTNQLFVSFFLSFVFEVPLRSYVLSHLLAFLSKGQDTVSDVLINMLVQIIQISSPLFPEEKFVILANDIVETLNEVLVHQRSITKYFEPLCAPIFDSLSRLVDSELAHHYIIQCITFFSLTALTQTVQSSQLFALETAIQTVFGNDIPQQLINKIIQMIAGEVVPSLNPTFLIRQPAVLELLLKISLKSNNLRETVQFIDQLCLFSASNCQACHVSEFDLFLIDFIKEMKNGPIEIVSALLLLFQHIASSISSVAVVQRYISLFSPIDGRRIPLNLELYLRTINNIIAASARLPEASLPLTKESTVVDIHGVPSDVANGFTFVFWIYLDSDEIHYKPSVVTITDGKGNKLNWFFSSQRQMFCTQRTTIYESNGRIDTPMPERTWSFVAVSYRVTEGEKLASMTPVFGCSEMKTLEYSPIVFQGSSLSVRIGGITEDSAAPGKAFSRLGSFGLFRLLTKDEITAISELGPRATGGLAAQPLFFYTIEDSGGALALREKFAEASIEMKMSSSAVMYNTTFTDILLNLCKVEVLLPLFSELDMKMPNGEAYPNLVKSVVELIGNTLSISRQAQDSFRRSKGFGIISHLLLSASDIHVDYSLYLQFFNLMQSITNTPLQANLTKEILINVELWLKCDAENHLRIVRHWARVLFPSLKNFLVNVTSIQELLYIMRVYYWYSWYSEEEEYIRMRNRVRGEELNVSECRQLLNNVAVILASESFSAKEYTIIESHCLTCADNRQVADMLRLVLALANAPTAPLKDLNIDMVSFLYNLFLRKDETVTVLAIEIMAAFHKTGLVHQFGIQESILHIQEQLSASVASPTMLKTLTELTVSDHPELLSICCWIALNLEEKESRSMLEQLHPDSKYVYHFTWCVWPILLCYHQTEPQQVQMLRFLIRCSVEEWSNIFATIYNIGLVLRENSSPLLSKLLYEITNYENQTAHSASILFSMAKFFVFFTESLDTSRALRFGWEHSPFGIPRRSPSHNVMANVSIVPVPPGRVSSERVPIAKHLSLDPSLTELSVVHPSKVTERFLKYTVSSSVFRFAIRWDEHGKWIDADLAKNVIRVFERFPLKNFIGMDLMLCSFLYSSDPEMAIAHIKSLDLTKEDISANLLFIQFFNHHAKLHGADQLLSQATHQVTAEGSFNCLNKAVFSIDNESKLSRRAMVKMQEFLLLASKKAAFHKFTSGLEEVISLSHRQILDGLQRRKKLETSNSRSWMHLWRCLAIDRAPWNCNTAGEAHFKRDNTYCAFFCPFKIKRNWKFDDHKQAVIARDNLSPSAAQNFIEEDLEHRSSRYSKKAPLPLLEIKDTDEVHEVAKIKDRTEMKRIILEAPCEYITTTTTTKRERLAIFFLSREYIKMKFLEDGRTKVIRLDEIAHLFFRRSYHRPNSIEIFTTMGKSYYIHFTLHNSLPILRKIASLSLPNIKTLQTTDFRTFFAQNSLTEQWRENEISNFEYLMHLNTMSGRTFNDLSQYPYFPWIFCDYSSPNVDLKDSRVFRNLGKPVGALDEDRLTDLLHRYAECSSADEEPFLYESGSICMLSACLYLLRLEPFTTQHIELQSGKFDHPSRLFVSIPNTYSLVTGRTNDFRELIPEFYFMPEFLMNLNHYDLGSTKDGRVDSVKLPSWASSAEEFIYIQRKGLESDFVSRTLSLWIDLVWGVNQKGLEAQAANNVFKSEMYEDAWTDETLTDLRRRAEIENVLLHIGQVPPQLFQMHHPPKKLFVQPYRPFTQPFSFTSGATKRVAVSRIQWSQSWIYKIITISDDGLLVTNIADFSKKKCTGRGGPKKRGERNSTPQFFRRKDPEAKSTETEIPIAEMRDVKLTFHSKQIPGFSQHEIDGLNYDHSIARLNDHIAAISGATHKVVLIDLENGTLEPMPDQTSEAVCVASSGDFFAVARTDAVLNIYRRGKASPIISMPSYGDSISCACVSATFYLAVIGTRDGSLIINSLNKGSTVRVLDLKGARPCQVIVTKAWGFIVVYAKKMKNGKLDHFLYAFNVNGTRLRKRKIGFPISAWTTWTSSKGFDFMLVSDDRGKLFYMEVFYLDIEESFFRCHSPVTSLGYSREISCSIVVTQDGRILFIPLVVPDL